MALQVWLPLTGNLKNLGLDNITVTNNGATINTAGKIGSCYNGTTSGQTIVVTVPDLATMLSNGKKYTFTCWAKMNSAAANTNQWIVKIGTNSCGFWWGYSSPRFVWNENNNGRRVADGETTSWHHFAVVVDKTVSGTITTWHYMDGTPVSGHESYSWDNSSQAQPAGNTITIYPYMAFLNDLRIYNDCLSPKEIKELSKGLVAHYPLNDGIGGANIAWNSSLATDLTNWSKSGDWDFVTKEGFKCCHHTGAFKTTGILSPKQTFNTTTDGMLPYNGLIITMSADVLLENVVKGTTNYYLALYQSGETINGSWRSPAVIANSGHFISAASNLLDPDKLNEKGWTHVWATYKWGDYAWSNTNYRLQFYARDYTGDVYVKNLKIELGEKPTPWIPNSADALYSKMGLDNGIVYDCSGYEHDGSVVNTTSVTSDAPRYKVTTYFNSGAYVRIDNIQSGNLEDSYTMAYWAKIANGKIPCGYRDGNRLNIYITNGLICCNTGDGNQNPFQLNGASINIEQYYNEWHHYAMSGDGFESKLYIDGEYKGSAKTYRPMTGTHFVINGWDFNTSYKINYISDVRIYATALSAEDIKSLYETRASIDNYNNIYAYELMEV